MKTAIITNGTSKAAILEMGSFVESLALDGFQIIKPSDDGVQTHGGIGVLMPYTDLVENGRYTLDGEVFQLPINEDGHALHGFAKDTRWRISKRGKSSISLTTILSSKGYPGRLKAQTDYSVEKRGFSTKCSVTNVSKKGCPFVVGFHPYFLAKDWKIRTKSKAYKYKLRDKYFPTGKSKLYSFDNAGPDHDHDDTFRVAGPIRFQSESYEVVMRRIRMPFLVVYNGRYADGRSVAIEPYTGITNAYNNGIGLRVLKPRESFHCGYEITLTRPA